MITPFVNIGALALGAIGAGINAIGGLFSNHQNAQYNAEEAQKNRDFQERMYKQQVEDNIKFWNMQNEYNLPSAVYQRQLQGMKENGLNPLLMYGDNGVSSIGTAQQAPQSPSAPHGSQAQSHFNNPFDLANLSLLKAQEENIKADTEKKKAEASNVGEQTTGLQFLNWLNDKTKNVQLAIKFRDWDRVNAEIVESGERVRNMREYNARAWSELTYQTNLAIRSQNLSEWSQGQYVSQGWEGLKIGRINANAALQSAAAAWLNAKSQWNLSNAQIGVLREQASNINWQNKWLKETFWNRVHAQSYITKQEYWKYQNLMMENLFKEAGIKNIDSQTWLNRYRADLMESQSMFYNMQTFMAPVNAFQGFGTPFQMGGNSFNGYQYTVTPGQ